MCPTRPTLPDSARAVAPVVCVLVASAVASRIDVAVTLPRLPIWNGWSLVTVHTAIAGAVFAGGLARLADRSNAWTAWGGRPLAAGVVFVGGCLASVVVTRLVIPGSATLVAGAIGGGLVATGVLLRLGGDEA